MKKLLAILSMTVGVAALAAPGQAADAAFDPGCYLAGDVSLGYLMDWQNVKLSDEEDSITGEPDWSALFGEGRGLVSCHGFNVQGDFSIYNHETEIDAGKESFNLSPEASHYGGALFWRDPNVGLFGVSGSIVKSDVLFLKDMDYVRIGAVGQYFVNDQLTFGASAHYLNGDVDLKNIDHEGFELAANAKYYVMPNFSLDLSGHAMISTLSGGGEEIDFNGWAAQLQAEYVAMEQGLSVFGGVRYANRTIDDVAMGGDAEIADTQAYIGIKFAFGGDGSSLTTRDRTGPIDNTSLFLEKLPGVFDSVVAGAADAEIGGSIP
ncbi:MAG: autotransporter outer membrane beta-barrel domain-containing protein [Proteobacteria bacterium]|nr:autotransporter outer membrane beta-barrel domain-containing protein [Pseudomonadota bacterium]